MLIAVFLAAQASAAATCPVEAADVPAGACSSYIFFDSGKAEIRREWETVLDDAVVATKAGGALVVTGHSDRPGSTLINRRIARLRAETVAGALQARGVPAGQITVRWDGEEQPLVATEDGVREIQNRRVTISIAR